MASERTNEERALILFQMNHEMKNVVGSELNFNINKACVLWPYLCFIKIQHTSVR